MNAAYAHVSASLLYKGRLCSIEPFVCQFIHFETEYDSAINLQIVHIVLV